MDANELGRWTRFAGKGGIGKCMAVQDCVAEEEEDLMFLKDDEIIVLMQLPGMEDVYLGYCEGVVGRFRGSDVRFLGRLKKPVMTKRSSRSLSRSSSRPSSSQSSAPTAGREALPSAAHRDSPSLPQAPSRMSYSYSASTATVTDTTSAVHAPKFEEFSNVVLPTTPQLSPQTLTVPSLAPDEDAHVRSVSYSSTSTAVDSTPRTPADFSHEEARSLVRIVSLSRQVESPTALDEDGALVTEIESKDATPLPPQNADIDEEGALLYANDDHQHEQDQEEPSSSFLESEPSMRISVATSEGETGIGLTLLQSFVNGDMDDGDADGNSVFNDSLDDSTTTVEAFHDAVAEFSTANSHVAHSHFEDASSRSSVYSHASHVDPELEQHTGSREPSTRDVFSRTSTHPSGTDSDYGGEEWEGASDIYDNYRYSRASMASKMSRLSRGSMHTTASGLALEAPPPIPTDSRRPSLDSLRHGGNSALTRDRFGSATASSSAEDVRRAARSMDATDPASPTGDSADGKETLLSVRRLPPPLDLTSSNYNRLAAPGTPSQAGFSPLLHTAFHSPLPSPSGLHSPTYLSPLSSPATTPLFSNMPGGAASALRQRLELGRASPLATTSRTDLAPSASSDLESRERARLSTEPIVVDDDDEAMHAVSETTVTTNMSQPTSPAASSLSFDAVSEKKRMIETTYIIANQAPPPPYTPMSATSGPSVAEPQDVFSHSPQPQLSPQLQPSSPQAIPRPRPAGERQSSNAFARRSLFLPHPHAPKPAEVPRGPMYGRAPVVSPPSSPQSGAPAGSPAHALCMALQVRGDPSRTRPVTIYANFDRELTTSGGPVPVFFSIERPSSVLGMRSRQHVSTPEASHVRAPSSPALASQPIPRANFTPQAQTARPRSRSMSDFDVAASDGASVDVREQSIAQQPESSVTRSLNAASPPESVSLSPSPSPSTPDSQVPRGPHKPSPLSIPSYNGKSPAFSTRPPPSPLSRPPLMSPSSPTVQSPVSDPGASTPSERSADVRSPSSVTVPLPSAESVQSPVSRSVSGSTVHSPTSPLKAYARNILRHSRSSTFSSKQSVPRDRSPQGSRSSLQGRRSAETDASIQSDSQLTSVTSPPPPPPPTTSLRSKLSLPTLKIKGGSERFAHIEQQSPTVSITPSETLNEQPTVQIKDVDFELVGPTQQLTSIDEDRPTSPLPSPSRPDILGALRAVSPVMSMKSGSSARTGQTQPAASEPPVLASPPPPQVNTQQVEAHRQRELRWITAMASTPASQARKSKKIRKLLYEGVPSSVRYLVWAHLTDSKARRMDNLYTKLIMRDQVMASASIERDVQRVFAEESQLLDGSLINILQAYLSMVPDVQYSRGLTVIAGRLLLQSPEEDAFWTFVSLMDTHMRLYFSPSRSQLEVDSMLFGKAVESSEPALAKKMFNDLDIPPISLCRPWFSALFLEALPFEHSQRVWDIFLFEGVTFLFRVGLAIIQYCKQTILMTSDRDAILNTLLHPPSALLPASADVFVETAATLKFKDDDVRKQRVKLEAQSKRQTQARNPILQGGTTTIITPLRPTTSNISLPRR